MQSTDAAKCGNVEVLFQPPQPGSPEEMLERRVRELFARMRGRDGKVPSPRFYEIAEDRRHPLRVITRRVEEAASAQVPGDELLELADAFREYVAEKVRRRRGRSHQEVA